MAKLAFSKLGLKKIGEVVQIPYMDNEDTIIEVKQYLPVSEKMDLISTVVNESYEIGDDKDHANPIKTEIYTILEIVYRYSNLSFTEKQKEDTLKLYDLLMENKVVALVLNAIPAGELQYITNGVNETLSEIYRFRNSAVGIMQRIVDDYSNVSFDAEEVRDKVGEENLGLLKDVVEKLG